MNSLKIVSVVGARPNLIKVAPFINEISAYNNLQHSGPYLEHTLVHTGQHYDDSMSESYFDSLKIPVPDINLEIGSGTHAEQIGRTMIAFEPLLKKINPDWVVVIGDVNAACSCSLTAKKSGIRLAHIEAGLRSYDRSMPEEVNRVIADQLSDLLLTPDSTASENLKKEGIPDSKIKCVGNIMIDTLDANRSIAEKISLEVLFRKNKLEQSEDYTLMDQFGVLTLHRPSNVDNIDKLSSLVKCFIEDISIILPLAWPTHPRTLKKLKEYGLLAELLKCPNILMLEPLAYHNMLCLSLKAQIMLTDSGGLQEESCVLGTPCLILREKTERPVTLVENGGACKLVGTDLEKIKSYFHLMKGGTRHAYRPPLWDGNTSKRIIKTIIQASDN